MKVTKAFEVRDIRKWTLGLAALFIAACSPQNDISKGLTGFSEALPDFGIFADRPTKIERILTIIRLKTPPLYATSDIKDNFAQVDPERRKAILAEQEELVKALKGISEKINVIYTYQMTLNAVAVEMPYELVDQVNALPIVADAEDAGFFLPPVLVQDDPGPRDGDQEPEPEPEPDPEAQTVVPTNITERNSVKFIGALEAHRRTVRNGSGVEVPLDGTGVKVGVIDSGIDYTHKMFGGAGTVAAFEAINADEPTPEFPNKRIVGGYDFAGSTFDPSSPDLNKHFPSPDTNPLAQGDHGTHVAGTIGGRGDGVLSHDGVAPGADLYALKVFGGGAASGTVVLAALEYAADPNKDGDTADRLDVVNLSLGHAFGAAAGGYAEAIKNLARGGVITVAAAGNEGEFAYITGAPGTVTEAISVAASMDDSDQNVLFKTVAVTSKTLGRLVLERSEGPVTVNIEKVKGVTEGPLVDLGTANEELTPELKAAVKGKMALISRGVKPFFEKITRAYAAGAIGVLMANNQEGAPVAMGKSDDKAESLPIPASMIDLKSGERIRAALKTGEEVRIEFKSPDTLTRLDNVDKIASFSSVGPRVGDSRIKPEITAPGSRIISAAAGKGDQVLANSGTSMAGPHIAGAMALMRQAFPQLSVAELKSVLMGRSVKLDLSVARQGAGRVQIDRALASPVVTSRSDISLGRVLIQSKKQMFESFSVKSLSAVDEVYAVRLESRHPGLQLAPIANVSLPAGGQADVALDFTLDAEAMKSVVDVMDGWIELLKGEDVVFRIPVLAVARKVSPGHVAGLDVMAAGLDDAAGAGVEIVVENAGLYPIEALLFNHIGMDPRKPAGDPVYGNERCDLEAAGYRIVEKEWNGGAKTQVLQIAAKLYNPLESFNYCELDVQFDADGDGVADQELATIPLKSVDGLGTPQDEYTFASVLFDAAKVREIRAEAEKKAKEAPAGDKKKKEKKVEADYKPAVLDRTVAQPLSQTTVAVVEVRIDKLKRAKTGDLAVQIALLQTDSGTDDSDDYLGPVETKEWTKISLKPEAQSFVGLPEKVEVEPGVLSSIRVRKGFGRTPLMALFPYNATTESDVESDKQMQLPDATYIYAEPAKD